MAATPTLWQALTRWARSPNCWVCSGPKTCLDVHTGVGVSRASDGELVRTKGRPDVVQFSGGEPSIHPQIIEMLRAAKRRDIRHVMLSI